MHVHSANGEREWYGFATAATATSHENATFCYPLFVGSTQERSHFFYPPMPPNVANSSPKNITAIAHSHTILYYIMHIAHCTKYKHICNASRQMKYTAFCRMAFNKSAFRRVYTAMSARMYCAAYAPAAEGRLVSMRHGECHWRGPMPFLPPKFRMAIRFCFCSRMNKITTACSLRGTQQQQKTLHFFSLLIYTMPTNVRG